MVRELTQGNKKERRAQRERDLAGKIAALPDKRYGVILADPEWQFEPWSRETGMDRAADNHYPTICLAVIKARDVPSIAAKDCALSFCATAPMLPHALLVMAAWGFDYVTNWECTRTASSPGTEIETDTSTFCSAHAAAFPARHRESSGSPSSK